MNTFIPRSSTPPWRRVPIVSVYRAQIIHFYTSTYRDFRQKDTSRLSNNQLESNLVPEEAVVDEEGSSNGSTVTAKAQIQESATAEASIVESAPTEIIDKILNNLLEQEFPDICSALCFGLTSRRNWAILRNLDHTSYLKEHMDQIPSIIDFKYDKIPLFNPYYEQAGSNSVDEESITDEYTLAPGLSNSRYPSCMEDEIVVKRRLKPSQREQLMLFREWMGPKYRPPTSLIIPYYLSCVVYGESIQEKIIEERFRQFIYSQALGSRIPRPFGLGDVWMAVLVIFGY
ncbi:uncharacterized protein EAF01_011573 [Botrytis porri]|uniref:F-box domain-containing protein n=1 Tax=Botrytis porri TaxID=87229 RepID=A0A4Z1K9L6_9HELO|nr:uncharacterized protein EAF01_011573 [Botrytis porri]KAF7884150.1 hypothetical protein EAF01_011573 [Botrytis porri]TGO82791.1 hypothetical protein BPOR_0758g00030 [Botrytis porri]